MSRSAEALLSGLVLLPPLLTNPRTLIFAFDAANPIVFVAAVATQLVIAHAIIDSREGDVARQVALVLAVEAGKRERLVQCAGLASRRLWRGQRRDVGAGGGAWFVGAVGAVAVVVVDVCGWDGDAGIGDAHERLGVLVELCD